MDLNSPLFDRIRAAPRADDGTRSDGELCQHPGCGMKGEFRAPQGRGREGRFFLFCLDHVRAYNQSYDYFAGMTDEAVQAYQKADMVGHRPTWRMGANHAAHKGAQQEPGDTAEEVVIDDPLGLFSGARRARPSETGPAPRVGNAARKALDTLGLEPGADRAAVKARYKELVKRLHPDANGGDRSREDKLREIINAYNYLKAAGFA
jgi:hypothetical protein